MNLLAEQIKLAVLSYWRLERQHQLGAIECWNSDVITMTKALLLTDTEVKTSIADMRRDLPSKYYKHRRFRETIRGLEPFTHYFYFAVPLELAEKASLICDERYPYAGLLAYDGQSMICLRNSKRHHRHKATFREICRIANIASNNIMKYGKLLANTNKEKE